MAVLTCVEAVFVAESFTTILEVTIDLGGDFSDALTLMALKAPQVLDFGIPIALLVGLYFAIIRLREEHTFTIFAGAGACWVSIPVFCGFLGLAAGFTSLAISAFLIPETNRMSEAVTREMRKERILGQLFRTDPSREIQEVSGMTFIMARRPENAAEPSENLFIYFPRTPTRWRVSLADDWVVSGPDPQENYVVTLRNFRNFSGRVPSGDLPSGDGGREIGTFDTMDNLMNAPEFSTIKVRIASLEFQLQSLIGEEAEKANAADLQNGDEGSASAKDSQERLRALAEKLARAILCPFAALLAALAVAVSSSRKSQLAALPIGVVILLALDVVARSILLAAASFGEKSLLFGALGLLAFVLSSVIAALGAFGESAIIHAPEGSF